jgi:hypothetical protein
MGFQTTLPPVHNMAASAMLHGNLTRAWGNIFSMKYLLLIPAVPAVWFLVTNYIVKHSTPEQRCGWHPDGRD